MANPLPSYAVLIVPVPIDRMFTYFIPEELRSSAQPGKRVIVQFGSRKFYTAIIYELVDTIPEGITPKSIDHILDEVPVIDTIHLKFWKWMADYYLCGPGEVMKAALPAGLRVESETKIEIHKQFSEEMLHGLQQHEQMIVMSLKDKENLSISEIQKILGFKNVFHLVKNLLTKGIVKSFEEYAERFVPKTETLISLAPEFQSDEAKLFELANVLSKKAPKQSDVLVYFIHETTVSNNKKRCSDRNCQSDFTI